MNTYSYDEMNKISKIPIGKITRYLFNNPTTIDVINVEDDRRFQGFDIDLIRVSKYGVDNIEVKSDTYDTGNFFFETVSNESKGTLGCFMYTCADYLHYYFVKREKLYILPMPLTRDWFVENISRFTKKRLATKRKSRILYYSYGYTVPIDIVVNEVEGVEVIKL